MLVRRFSQLNLIIHADQDSDRFCVGGEGTTSRTGNGVDYTMIVRAEVHVVAFQKCRPAPREHPFNTTTGRPACSGVTEICQSNTIKGEVAIGISPGHAALTVDQPGGRHRIADAARQGVEPWVLS